MLHGITGLSHGLFKNNKEKMEEARRKDFEKYTGAKQVNTKVKNDKLIKLNPDIKLLLENQSVDVNKMIPNPNFRGFYWLLSFFNYISSILYSLYPS